MKNMPRDCPEIHIINVIWGADFVQTFLEASLPSQLTDGNLGFFKEDVKPLYKIYTTPEDSVLLEKSSTFQKLKKKTPTQVIPIVSKLSSGKYNQVQLYHALALKEANFRDAALIFMCPDKVMSDGTYRYLYEALKKNRRVVATLSIRLSKAGFMKELNHYYHKEGQKDFFTPRKLIFHALRHLNPYTTSMFWGGEKISRWPSHLYWRIDSKSFLARGYHLHPLLVWPENKDVELDSTIDGHFIDRVCPSYETWDIVEDSDNIADFELSEDDLIEQVGVVKCRLSQLSYWVRMRTLLQHRKFIDYKVYYHSEELKPHWKEVEESSDKVIDQIKKRMEAPSLLDQFLWVTYAMRDSNYYIEFFQRLSKRGKNILNHFTSK